MNKQIKQGIDIIEEYESSTGVCADKYIYNEDATPVIIEKELLNMLMDNLQAGDFYNQCQDIIDAVARIQHAHQNGGVGAGLKTKPKGYDEWAELLLTTLKQKTKIFEFVYDHSKKKRLDDKIKKHLAEHEKVQNHKDGIIAKFTKSNLPGRDKVAKV